MKSPRNTAKRPGRSINEELRRDAMRMLAEGMAVVDVAREMGVDRSSVRMWRDTPEGQALLADATRARAKALEGTVDLAREMLRQNAARAVQALVDDLRIPGRRSTAAREILDRIGVLKASELRISGTVDLSKLSDAALAELEAANKADE